MKYQFCIRFNEIDVNSSASKAVIDCNTIFSANGYVDYTFTVPNNKNKKNYYYRLFKEVVNFYYNVQSGSLVGIQYPLLSINNVFKFFIKATKFKKVKYFCIIHDIEALRTGGTDLAKIKTEIINLNYYDLLIVHNNSMKQWLSEAGVKVPMVSLKLFDYLTVSKDLSVNNQPSIVYAGNLAKSTFIYKLPIIYNYSFTVYGPGCSVKNLPEQVFWGGEFSPEEVVEKLNGSFGLIWDGKEVDRCDEVLGNYLYYNNPHKASLYLAAGLPLIAPQGSAIGEFILEHNIGVVIGSIHELESMRIDGHSYTVFKNNVLALRDQVASGYFFNRAIQTAEERLAFNS